jgi:sugar O-acyltransferase (sialic acid O-acetyltransferase NeuD family)
VYQERLARQNATQPEWYTDGRVRLVILGDGTFAVETLDIADAVGGWTVVGFLNSLAPADRDRHHAGLPVFGLDTLPFLPGEGYLVAGLVSTRRRAAVETLAGRGHLFATLVHPSAVVSPRARVEAGAVIGAQAAIGSNASVEAHVVVNRGALVGHDVVLGRFSTLGPGANVAGAATVGEGAYIGLGAIVREQRVVGAGAVVAAGALVVKDVEPGVMVAGVPATVMRRGVEGL